MVLCSLRRTVRGFRTVPRLRLPLLPQESLQHGSGVLRGACLPLLCLSLPAPHHRLCRVRPVFHRPGQRAQDLAHFPGLRFIEPRVFLLCEGVAQFRSEGIRERLLVKRAVLVLEPPGQRRVHLRGERPRPAQNVQEVVRQFVPQQEGGAALRLLLNLDDGVHGLRRVHLRSIRRADEHAIGRHALRRVRLGVRVLNLLDETNLRCHPVGRGWTRWGIFAYTVFVVSQYRKES